VRRQEGPAARDGALDFAIPEFRLALLTDCFDTPLREQRKMRRSRLGARETVRVEHALRAVLLNTVALDVAKLKDRCLGAPPAHPGHMRLDDHAARVRSWRPHRNARAARLAAPPTNRAAARTALRSDALPLRPLAPRPRPIIGVKIGRASKSLTCGSTVLFFLSSSYPARGSSRGVRGSTFS
jgi:hypothetical protein